jgi:hypothetical protein
MSLSIIFPNNKMIEFTKPQQHRSADWVKNPVREPFVRAPAISYTVPEQDARGVPIDPVIKIVFAVTMKGSTINDTNITLAPTAGGPNVEAAVSLVSDDTAVAVAPTSSLDTGTQYTLTVTTDVQASNDIPLATEYSFSFTTVEA